MSRQLATQTRHSAWTTPKADDCLLQRKRPNGAGHELQRAAFDPSEVSNHDFGRIPMLAGARPPLQPKLTVSAPGDAYEQEADSISEQVMLMREPQLQRACACGGECAGCKTEESGEEEPRVQTKRVGSGDPGHAEAPPVVNEVLRSPGQPLDASTRAFMEPRFGHDFSRVRVRTDAKAAESARAVNALAYTSMNNIVFGAGQYAPGTSEGRRLLAHELTHVIQQGGDGTRIQRTPNPNPPPEPFIEGRPAHPHPALGIWSAVQSNARSECLVQSGTRARSECACAVMSSANVLAAAGTIEMFGKPLALQHLNHYISGGGVDFDENTNLDNLMTQDAGARAVVANAISGADRGNVFIQQGDYSDQNFRYAFGGIDRVDYKVDRPAGTVDVWFKDRYDFHPAGFGHTNMGTGDLPAPGRETNCVHLAAVEEKANGAADFWMIGHATLPLSLFTTAPTPPPAPTPGPAPAPTPAPSPDSGSID
ncbi:MAG TPA: DUF4157 domain-containing protein [Pyrinomonadaceae bacterium]